MCKILVQGSFFDGGEIRVFLEIQILNFTWLPWQPGDVMGPAYPLIFKTWYTLFWSILKQPFVSRMVFYVGEKPLKSGEIREFYGMLYLRRLEGYCVDTAAVIENSSDLYPENNC